MDKWILKFRPEAGFSPRARSLMTVVLVALIFSLILPVRAAAAEVFTDIKSGDWYYPYALEAKALGIISGYPDGSFKPSRSVSYAEFLSMVLRGASSANTGGSSHWCAGTYYKGMELGYYSEADIVLSGLDEPIPRKDMALIIAGALTGAGKGGISLPGAQEKFSDVNASDSFEYHIALCNHYGVLSGYPDGTFRPGGFLSRAEAAAAVVGLGKVLNPGPEPPQTAASEDDGVIDTREELLAYSGHTIYSKEFEAVRYIMDPVAKEYAEAILNGARFQNIGSKYYCDFSWPALPEGYSARISINYFNRKGGQIGGYLWLCGKMYEGLPTYVEELLNAGSKRYTLNIKSLSNSGKTTISVFIINDLTEETTGIMYGKDQNDGQTYAQYAVGNTHYRISCIYPLSEGNFLWK